MTLVDDNNGGPSAVNENASQPRVLIAGAGLAGLLLGNLLEKANIPYEIYERAKEILPLGSVICLSANILPAFEQLGLYEELMKFACPSYGFKFLTSKLKRIGEYSAENDKEITGYDRLLFARPELYQLLHSRIPAHKIKMSKKVVSFTQDENGVIVRLQDDTIGKGDILVGADGAYSAVRQHLYKELAEQGKLPRADERKMLKGYICLVGTTDALDIAKYPGIDAPHSDASLVVGDSSSPYTWALFTVPGNKICWNVVVQLEVDASEDDKFKNSEWSSTTNEKMIKEIYHFKTQYGILGDLIDATPKERISRVFFEDMLYETWSHGRTVLIGDAAHKLLPSTGQGAVNALQDAVILANCLYDLQPVTNKNIQTTLKDYRDQRYHHVKTQYDASHISAKLQFGHTWFERLLRHVVFNYLPKSLQRKQVVKDAQYRPQIAFLPLAPKRGTGPALPQKPSRRYTEEQKQAKMAQN